MSRSVRPSSNQEDRVNKVMLLAVASGVVALASGTALAGPPAWCKDASADEPRMSDMGSKDSADVLKAFVAAECHPIAEVEAHRADIEKARAAWSKRLGMAEDDWADAVAYVNLGNDHPKADLTTKKLLDLTPLDQWIAMGNANSDSQGGMDAFYVADIFDAKLSEVGRLKLIGDCIRSDSAIRWESSQVDIDKLDFTKMYDVRDDPFKGVSYSALPVAVKFPAVNLAAIAVVICNQRPGIASELGAALASTPGMRGPHNFAISRMADASLQLDDMSKSISWPTMHHPYHDGTYLASAGANIKSIKKHGDHLTIESAPMMVTQEDCVSEHVGKHIERVHDDGRVDYERICDKTAMVKHDVSWAPFEINARYEKLLKVGQMFSATYGDKDADIIAIWASPKAAAPMWMLGGNLK